MGNTVVETVFSLSVAQSRERSAALGYVRESILEEIFELVLKNGGNFGRETRQAGRQGEHLKQKEQHGQGKGNVKQPRIFRDF